MTTAGTSSATTDVVVERALVAASVVAFCLSIALQDWVQATAVALTVVVAVTKLRDPHAAWLTWMPRLGRS